MKPNFILHASNAHSTGAMLEIRAEHGWMGYGLAWGILECVASGKYRTIPMIELRQTMLEMACDRPLFLQVLKMMQSLELLATKAIVIDGFRDYHLYSPLLEAQLQSKEMQRMARALYPGPSGARPAIPQDVRRRVLSAGCCAYCGSTDKLEIDHIYPYSRGGAHDESNFQALCKTCNMAKRDKTEEEYFALIRSTDGPPPQV